ncbi:conserved exported hypothetical protein [Paraburkholderia piptadeniae]|uniref:Uncharacterized protein n=1 Tax=Paraburkholderia piptadeniae TaxID=1701573 RepID=A0A1N7RUL9_9BURK|nr:hypothetical protein [Paraburkholderia piptadeniae]SIT38782.1 conserved exported hypothetical protein [Paraburkholderia piptadeniae]
MSRFMTRCGLGWLLLLVILCWVGLAKAQQFQYQYVSLDAAVPAPFLFWSPSAITDGGRVYGTLYSCGDTNCDYLVTTTAVWAAGTITPRQPGITYTANDEGTVGGSVLTDPVNFLEQAALFHSDGSVELIPRQPGEVTSRVTALNDSDTAIVVSFSASSRSWVLYQNHRSTLLNFGPTIANPSVTGMNNQGIICGITDARGFRFDPRTNQVTLLNPVTEPEAWTVGINSRGDMLGWSFVPGALERIGVWDPDALFQTFFVEGTPQYPTVSNELVFNDHNQIVVSEVNEPTGSFQRSYLVPTPGVRLNIADLVGNLPSGLNLGAIQGINNHGDMIGFDFYGGGDFLLQRVDASGSSSTMAANAAPNSSVRKIPAATAAGWRRYMSPQHAKFSAGLPQGIADSLLLRVR